MNQIQILKENNMKKITIFGVFLLSVFFSGCDNLTTTKNYGVDNYYFEKETFTRTNFPVEIVLVQSSEEMAKLIQQQKHVQGTVEVKNVMAFSTIRKNDTTCTIYMIDPKVKYGPEWYGHELVHCIYGVWHSEPQS